MNVMVKLAVVTRAVMRANVLGYPSILNEEEFGSDIDIGQSIEQSNTCGGGASWSNQASNVANIG